MNILPRKDALALLAATALLIFATTINIYDAKAEGALATSKPLWVALSQAVVRVDPASGKTLVELTFKHDPEALAVDETREKLWVYSKNSLQAYDFAGEQLHEQVLTLPTGGSAVLHVNNDDGTVWLASHKRLLSFETFGELLFDRQLDKAYHGAALDSQRGILWLGQSDTLIAIDRDGTQVQHVSLNGLGRLHALGYDNGNDAIKFVAGETLYKLLPSGEIRLLLTDRRLRHITHLGFGENGALWLADDHNLLKINAEHHIDLYTRPLQQYSPELIVDLAANADSGLWLANWRELVRVSSDGNVLAAIQPQTSGNRTRNILGLASRTGLGAPRLEIVSPTDGAFLNTASPQFELQIDGSNVDIGSIEFLVNGDIVIAGCDVTDEPVQCQLNQSLPDGSYLVSASVADDRARRSQPAEVNFVIDTVAPGIVVDFPEDTFVTNIVDITVRGRIDEPATVQVDNTTVDQENDLSFSFGPLTLVEGGNTITVSAVDRADNQSQEFLLVMLDTAPPVAPDSSLIEVNLIDAGIVRITGAAGSVEALSKVTVINTRTGEHGTVQADSGGGFTVELAAEVGDALHITASDIAGNDSEVSNFEVVAEPGAEPIRLSFVSPQQGASLSGDFILVTLKLDGPVNTGVLVNNQPATLLPDSDGRMTAYAWVSVESASTTLTATATAPDERTTTVTRDVHQLQESRYEVVATRLNGIAPFEVAFEVRDIRGLGIRQISLDADGDGHAEQVSTTPENALLHTYEGSPTLHEATFSIVDNAGTTHLETVPIIILDPDYLDQQIRGIWSGLTEALTDGEIDNALSFMAESSRAHYQPVFEALLPYMPEITDGFSDIYQLDLSGDMASYLMMTVENDKPRVFVVQFLRDNHGIWRVDSF